MKQLFTLIFTAPLLPLAGVGTSYAQQPKATATLIQNVNIFDGRSDQLLTHGFTTIRDTSGDTLSLKKSDRSRH